MILLLDLPKDALNNVLKTMDKLSLMVLSILSKRTMTLVKLLKVELGNFTIDLQDRVSLDLIFKDNDRIWI